METRDTILKLDPLADLEFQIEFESTSCDGRWPVIEISGRGIVNPARVEIQNKQTVTVVAQQLNEHQTLNIQYINKTEGDTKVNEHGKIYEDQTLSIKRIFCDNILMEPWFITDGNWYPKYFPGFLSQYPESEHCIKSLMTWHFPGVYVIDYHTKFWPWYSNTRRGRVSLINIDKDEERWENISGSQKRHYDLEQDIWRLLHV